ncbi:MAG: hypothetical protein B9S32_13735 [Verrucomicrobia bacterium Tous-C9LFEB]|nr:MAG: hypothetical protein B9S32_13735 [Verrucomicrobia bacterium Tous-C9LFEB]
MLRTDQFIEDGKVHPVILSLERCRHYLEFHEELVDSCGKGKRSQILYFEARDASRVLSEYAPKPQDYMQQWENFRFYTDSFVRSLEESRIREINESCDRSDENRSDSDIVDQTNALAREFYRLMGYVVRDGYRFDQAHHPQEKMCWAMACHAQETLTETDPNDVLSEEKAS